MGSTEMASLEMASLDMGSIEMGSIELDKGVVWPREAGRHGQRPPVRWLQLGKALVGFGAVIAVMSGLLYADVWLKQESRINTIVSID